MLLTCADVCSAKGGGSRSRLWVCDGGAGTGRRAAGGAASATFGGGRSRMRGNLV